MDVTSRPIGSLSLRRGPSSLSLARTPELRMYQMGRRPHSSRWRQLGRSQAAVCGGAWSAI